MIKKILAFSLILNIILAGVTAFAVPSVDYMFLDDETEKYYVFGSFDKENGIPEDLGIYFKGLKYSYAKNGDTTSLDKQMEEENPKFGISFKAPPEYMETFRVKPYVTLSGGKEIIGKQKSYNKETNSIKDDYVFDADFEWYYPGDVPYDLICETSDDTNAEIAFVEKNGEYTNALKLSDETTTGIATATCELDDYTENLTLEFKIKMSKTITEGYGFIIDFLDENEKRAFRIVKYSNASSTTGLSFVNSGGNTTFTAGVDMNNEWFTLKLFMDSERKYSSLAIENNIYKEEDFDLSELNFVWQDKEEGRIIAYNLPWYNEYNAGNNIKYIKFSTYGNTAGEYLIDDINIYTNGEDYRPKRTRAESKTIRVIADPQ